MNIVVDGRFVKFRLALATAVGLACGARLSHAVVAQDQTPSHSSDAAPSTPITIEFELPDEYSERAADGNFRIQGFRVGYFKGSATTPVRTVVLWRHDVEIRGQTARLRLPPSGLPPGSNVVVIRLQSVSSGTASGWSDPSPPVTLPIDVLADKAGRRPARLRNASLDLDAYPRLKAALTPLLSSDFSAAEAATAFRRVETLAQAVVLARRHKLSLRELSSTMKGPPPRSVLQALGELRPSLDLKQAVRDARREVSGLVERPQRQMRQR